MLAVLGVLGVLGIAAPAAAQIDADAADRRTAINALRLGVLHVEAPAALRPSAPDGVEPFDAGPRVGLAAASLEKRGADVEVVRLDGLGYAVAEGTGVLSWTALDIRSAQLGAGQDGEPCMASLILFAGGDCVRGGVLGFRLLAMHQQHDFTSARYFYRWFELGLVAQPLGDSFDVDFIESRLPFLVGVSLDTVTNVTLAPGEPPTVLRGVAGLDSVWRSPDFRWELEGGLRYRPALAPFDLDGDWAFEVRARAGYIFLAALGNPVKESAARLYLEAGFTHWSEPFRADDWPATRAENTLQLLLGTSLTFRDLSPS